MAKSFPSLATVAAAALVGAAASVVLGTTPVGQRLLAAAGLRDRAAAPAIRAGQGGEGGNAEGRTPKDERVLAAGGEAVAQGDDERATNEAEALFVRAVEALEAHETVAARLRYRVDLFGHRLTGSGSYVQGPWRHRLLRLELRTQVGQSLTSVQHVADGEYLWIYRELVDNPSVSRVNLERVHRALGGEAGVFAPDRPPPVDALGLGGLPRLMRSMHRWLEFTGSRDADLTGVPVTVFEGHWRPEFLRLFLLDQEQQIMSGGSVDLTKLAEHVPDRVLVHLGRDDLFPYRIEYQRTRAAVPEEKRTPEMPEARSLLTVEFFEVQLDAPVDSLEFVFNPGSLPAAYVTDEYLERLKAVQPQAATSHD
jgi:hypothetical protein